ncbi:unnamed protein product [Staurois parvus]|uniref:Uncharacterized protein n=1 Tax=Staurois parvus TaxID=386267 RepID=A0ABN9C4H6_9NEOB|nr:unnamed protein product [Staurois parvus]
MGTGGWHWWTQVGGTGGHRWVALVGTGGWHRWVHCWAQVADTGGCTDWCSARHRWAH